MRISKETSTKSLKYFGDILHCKTKKEIANIRYKHNASIKDCEKREKRDKRMIAELCKAAKEAITYQAENKPFDAIENEYLW